MTNPAGISDDPSTEKDGHLGFLLGAVERDVTNPYVMSALEDGAHHRDESIFNELEGIFTLEHLQFSGNLSVIPGLGTGSSRLGLYLKGNHADVGLRLHAEVRSTWLTFISHLQQERLDKAVAIAAALVGLATIPGQRTVSVNGDYDSRGAADELMHYFELFKPKRSQAA